jgi:phosphopantothenoylcysteine decarboxylase/phosphopantothenate--cysteine ligase
MSRSKILFQLTGSIAAYKACHVISRLVQEGHEVEVACTANALEFIGPATLEGLTGRPIFRDTYQPGRQMDHVHLAKWADLAIVCPATAATLNRLAQGLGDDVIGTLFLAYDLRTKPYLVAPAMNQEMMRHPAVEASLARLREWSVRVLPTESGYQACGDVGPGRLLRPDRIFEEIQAALAESRSQR